MRRTWRYAAMTRDEENEADGRFSDSLLEGQLFDIYLTDAAKNQLERLKKDKGLEKRYHAVKKAINFLSENPSHKSLQTHEFTSLIGPKGKKTLRSLCEAIHSCR